MEDMQDHHDAPMFRNKPWIIFGDFNEIMYVEEHSGFHNSPSISSGMRDFHNILHHCFFLNMVSQGLLFTWCNKRDVEFGLISKKN